MLSSLHSSHSDTMEKNVRSKDTVFTTQMLLPLCIFLPSFPEGMSFLSHATARARSAKESEWDWECSNVYS